MHRMLPIGAFILAFTVVPLKGAEDKGQKDNTPPEGFPGLFNGKDLTNWKGLIELPERSKLSPEKLANAQKRADKELSHWKVEEGLHHFDGKRKDLQAARDQGNSDPSIHWQIKESG